MVAGKLVVVDRKPVGIDEAALAERLAKSVHGADELLKPADDLFEQIEPYVAAAYEGWEAKATELLPTYYQYNTR